MSRLYACALVLVLFVCGPVFAGSKPHGIFGKQGFYLAASAGATFPTSSKLTKYQGASLIHNTVNLGVGPEANVAMGMYVGRFRLEGEVGYRRNDLTDSSFPGLNRVTSASGHIDSVSLMGNGYYDIAVSDGIQWYIGVGGGIAREHANTSVDIQGVSPLNTSGTDWVPAFQFMTGVTVRVAPKVHVNVGYRFWTTTNPTFNGSKFDAPADHTVEVGLRFDF